MQIKATREIKNSEVSTTLTVEALGSDTITAEEEREILEDYVLIINYAEAILACYVAVDDHQNPYIVEMAEKSNDTTTDDGNTEEPAEVGADLVILHMPYETHEITEDMSLKFAVNVDDLKYQVNGYKTITDPICLAKSMCLVFENAVTQLIKEKLEASRKHRDDFEKEEFYLI